MAGPLSGVRVVEIGSIGPGPFCAMALADMGAEVLRLDRTQHVLGLDEKRRSRWRRTLIHRGRRSIGVDLKHPDGVAAVLRLVEQADVLIEGFRPGVCERLGVGPDVCLAHNPRLVYGRATGWGQDGPYAPLAGHDINYIALAGALYPIGRAGQAPVPPLNLVGDYAGGGMMLAFGIVAALVERARSGQGQVIDSAMVEGAALLTTIFHGRRATGEWTDTRGANLLDSGAPFYDVYETADGQYVSIGSLEPKFYAQLIEKLLLAGLQREDLPEQMDQSRWPEMKRRFAALFRTRTRQEWVELLEGTDTCFAPVLSMAEAPEHPHNKARGVFVEVDGLVQPGPAPRFSRTPGEISRRPPVPGEHTDAALPDWGFSSEEIAALRRTGAIA